MHPLAKIIYDEVHKDDGKILKKNYINPFYHLRVMDKTIMLHEYARVAK